MAYSAATHHSFHSCLSSYSRFPNRSHHHPNPSPLNLNNRHNRVNVKRLQTIRDKNASSITQRLTILFL